ncbi:helix-turn-helix domain-containing protein [Nocardioides speluncae]|uniref:helix-turn-helix domain-containing protein n=1 Tax=Nocardioides speluncae TaxID=2670337 RepID=UPI000D69767E|nr:helix-turn-helix domain-containing protein [Nocardioides speluncae]
MSVVLSALRASMDKVDDDSVTQGYVELPAELPDVFRCAWRRTGSDLGGASATVLPDGCADIIVDQSGGAVLVGPTLLPHRHALGSKVTLRGLRLQPWAVPLLFRLTATEVRDRVLPLDALVGSRWAREIAAEVWRGRVPRRWRSIDTTPWQMDLVKGLLRAPSGAVEVTGREWGVSERHARRAVRDLTGMSPRELGHVGRLQRLLPLLDEARFPLARLAAEAGYTDQAHMSRDLKRLAGVTPLSLRRERSGAAAWPGGRLLTGTEDLVVTPGSSSRV